MSTTRTTTVTMGLQRLRCARMFQTSFLILDKWIIRLVKALSGRFPEVGRGYDYVILRHRMRKLLGYDPNLRNPQTYNEKLAWRILYDRNPLLAETTDKLAVRQFVSARVGPDVLIPVLGVYERADDIPWDELPDKFVLKATHGCDMNYIVHDKKSVTRREVLKQAQGWLEQNYYDLSRERAYRDIPRRLMIEQLLEGDDGEIPADYKFLVFHGRVALIRVHTGRFGDHRVNFFDANLQPAAVRQIYPVLPSLVLPEAVRGLIVLAEKLAQDFDYARVDLYLCGDRAWFGEITHHDGNASVFWRPLKFDAALGALWRLPQPDQTTAVTDGDTESWRNMESMLRLLRDAPQ